MPRMDEGTFQWWLSNSRETLKEAWLNSIEPFARQGLLEADQFQALYRKAYGAEPGPSVMQTFFPAGGAGPGAGAGVGAGTRTQADILFYSKYGRWPEPGEATVSTEGGGAGDTFFDANGNEVPAGDPGAAYRRDSTGAFFSVSPGGGGGAAPPLGGGGAAGTTPPGMVNTGAGLPGAGEEDLLAQQPLGDQYMRFLLGQPQYQKGSGFLRGTAESKAGDLWNRWLLSQAEDPQGFNLNAISGEAEAPQDWLGYLTGGAARPTRGQARGSLQNILGQLEAGTVPENAFGQAMWEQFGPDVEGGGENLRDLILQVTGMGIPSQLRGSFTQGARRRFEQQRVQQPGGRVQDWARQWGLL